MTLLQHYQIILILNSIITPTVGIWIFLQRRTSKIAQLFCLYSICVSFWSWCQAEAGISKDPTICLFWVRTMFFAVIMFPVLLTHFFAAFLRIDARRACRLGWILVIGFLPFSVLDQFLKEGGPLGFLYSFPRAGPLFLLFNLAWFSWIFYDLWLLVRGPTGSRPSRSQINFLLVAFVLGYLTGCTNYLYFYGIYIPMLHPFANYGVSVGFLIIAYGVFAYDIFDVQFVIRKSLVYSALVTLLTAGYFGLVYGIERIFQNTLGYKSIWVSLAAFALMALLFQPLKIKIQRLVDWLIFRVPQEELAKRIERLEEQALQAEKFKAVSTMAAGMAHEIKNPLTAIKTFAEFIPEKHRDPAFAYKLQDILMSESQRIQNIVQDILDFSKPRPPQTRPVELEKLIDSTVNLLSNELTKQKIKWVVDCQHNGTAIHADANQLRQVLINLIQNAADAMPTGGTLTIATQNNNGHLELTISDTGYGIPKELLPKIFDPFVTTKSNGNGLGLAMVYSIIQSHRGTISAESTVGHGTIFTLRLPV